ncbi:MAG: hypothetical protein U0V75_16060 [Ferruginibacter sp.]
MKKIIITAAIVSFASLNAAAQITKPIIIKKQMEPVKTTAPAPPPAPVYTLAAVKANIRTGADNKEYPSVVWAFLSSNSPTANCSFKQESLKNEMRSNSNTEFGLEKPVNNSITLDDLQKNGCRFTIWYFANFQFDAWKIEGVSITLEFRDQQGNLHPTLGQKTITFGNANGFLNGYGETRMICTTDGYFNPLTAQITK